MEAEPRAGRTKRLTDVSVRVDGLHSLQRRKFPRSGFATRRSKEKVERDAQVVQYLDYLDVISIQRACQKVRLSFQGPKYIHE